MDCVEYNEFQNALLMAEKFMVRWAWQRANPGGDWWLMEMSLKNSYFGIFPAEYICTHALALEVWGDAAQASKLMHMTNNCDFILFLFMESSCRGRRPISELEYELAEMVIRGERYTEIEHVLDKRFPLPP